ncbi:MAG TPA: DNA-3-methyladenine glycosylase I [Polyangiaceae bacterium]|jgi:DNA-3-methyladenine glycosylase I|nr:DNA-3-methyladenine glycosylase I [Polyangiaceae bacterium]
MKELKRCHWSGEDPGMISYHDEEWGVPLHDDRGLFEFLILEGAQAGLSWSTVLRKRDAYRKAFKGFDPKKVSRLTESDRALLLTNEGIIRNRAKIASTVENAKAFLAVQKEFGSFDAYLWGHVKGKPVVGKRKTMADVPAVTPLAESVSKDLKKRGFGFVGPTIIYALLQAVGVVNDHLTTCFRYRELTAKP